MAIEATFVRSAASAGDLPRDGLAEIALVGRSNVGKSRLINALVRCSMARTSASPGKTRLANLYRVSRGSSKVSAGGPFYLVDLPGYGYARRAKDGGVPGFEAIAADVFAGRPAALLLVDARHPGLDSDVQAWAWLRTSTAACAIVRIPAQCITNSGQYLA